MTRIIRSAGLAIALLAGAGLAFAAPAAGQAKPAAKTIAKTTSHSITGTLDSASSNSITLTTPSGKETMTLADSTQIRSGAKKLAAADLSAQTGHTVKVRYKEANGQKTAESVQVQAAPRAKTAKKS